MTAELVRETGAEVVIVATGAAPRASSIRAADAAVVSAWDVLSGRARVGANVGVIGGGEVGCEVAEYLATRGARVAIVEMLGDLALAMEPRGRTLLLQRLRGLGVTAMVQCRIVAVQGSTVTYEQGGLPFRLQHVETVVSAIGSTSDTALGDADVIVHRIGDCREPRRILEAIREGFETAYAI